MGGRNSSVTAMSSDAAAASLSGLRAGLIRLSPSVPDSASVVVDFGTLPGLPTSPDLFLAPSFPVGGRPTDVLSVRCALPRAVDYQCHLGVRSVAFDRCADARGLCDLLVGRRLRFNFDVIAIVGGDAEALSDIFGETLKVTVGSVWHPDEFPTLRPRAEFPAIADENTAIYRERRYINESGAVVDIAAQIARARTEVISPEAPLSIVGAVARSGTIEATQETTIGALYRLIVLEGLRCTIALNFANAHCAGGGYLGCARAQEEACCRCSTLYYEISAHGREYYEYNNRHRDDEALFSDYEIITRDMIAFRDDQYRFLEQPFYCAFLTSPAPMAKRHRAVNRTNPREKLHEVMMRRIRRIIVSAIDRGFESIVLGAYGCGAVGNDPEDTAAMFHQLLVADGLRQYFEKVVFAVFDPMRANWCVFQRYFGQVQ
jgi:uncharacterized protein (TIGR02452 family)